MVFTITKRKLLILIFLVMNFSLSMSLAAPALPDLQNSQFDSITNKPSTKNEGFFNHILLRILNFFSKDNSRQAPSVNPSELLAQAEQKEAASPGFITSSNPPSLPNANDSNDRIISRPALPEIDLPVINNLPKPQNVTAQVSSNQVKAPPVLPKIDAIQNDQNLDEHKASSQTPSNSLPPVTSSTKVVYEPPSSNKTPSTTTQQVPKKPAQTIVPPDTKTKLAVESVPALPNASLPVTAATITPPTQSQPPLSLPQPQASKESNVENTVLNESTNPSIAIQRNSSSTHTQLPDTPSSPRPQAGNEKILPPKTSQVSATSNGAVSNNLITDKVQAQTSTPNMPPQNSSVVQQTNLPNLSNLSKPLQNSSNPLPPSPQMVNDQAAVSNSTSLPKDVAVQSKMISSPNESQVNLDKSLQAKSQINQSQIASVEKVINHDLSQYSNAKPILQAQVKDNTNNVSKEAQVYAQPTKAKLEEKKQNLTFDLSLQTKIDLTNLGDNLLNQLEEPILSKNKPRSLYEALHDNNQTEDKESMSLDQAKFLSDESQMLLFPDDDIILGQLSDEARIEQMDCFQYMDLYEKYLNKFSNIEFKLRMELFEKKYFTYQVKPILSKVDLYNIVDYSMRLIEHGELDGLRVMLDNYNVLQMHDENAESLLTKAVKVQNYEIVKYLIKRGANINYRNGDKKTAKMLATELSNLQIKSLLNAAGAIR